MTFEELSVGLDLTDPIENAKETFNLPEVKVVVKEEERRQKVWRQLEEQLMFGTSSVFSDSFED